MLLLKSVDNLKAQLPLLPGSAASVTVYVYGASDFIIPAYSAALASLQHADELNSLHSLSGGGMSLSTASISCIAQIYMYITLHF